VYRPAVRASWGPPRGSGPGLRSERPRPGQRLAKSAFPGRDN